MAALQNNKFNKAPFNKLTNLTNEILTAIFTTYLVTLTVKFVLAHE